MGKMETVQDFKKFLETNRDKLIEKSINIEDLPPNDDWIQDDRWDELYKN